MATKPQLIDSLHTFSLNFTIKNEDAVERLIDLRIPYSERNQSANRVHNDEFTAQAREIGRDPFRFGRKGPGGMPLADSGRLMFGREKPEGDAFTFGELSVDLERLGFNIADVNLLLEGRRARLFVNWRKEATTKVLTPQVKQRLERVLGGFWKEIQGFRNPDGRWNVNVRGGQISNQDLSKLANAKSIRLASSGETRLVHVAEPKLPESHLPSAQ